MCLGFGTSALLPCLKLLCMLMLLIMCCGGGVPAQRAGKQCCVTALRLGFFPARLPVIPAAQTHIASMLGKNTQAPSPHPHCTGGETEAWGRKTSCLRSDTWVEAELRPAYLELTPRTVLILCVGSFGAWKSFWLRSASSPTETEGI